MEEIPAVYISNVRSKLLQLKYDDNKLREKLRTWNCLQSHIPRKKATDCVVSSLHFMDIITDRKVAEDSAQYLTTFKHGANYDDIVYELFKYFRNQHGFSEHNLDETNNMNPYKEWIEILNRDLKREHLTMVLLKYTVAGKDGRADTLGGHAAIVYKDKDNQLHLIDSQQETVASSDKEISDYFKTDRYVKLILIKTSNKRTLSQNALTLRKTKSSNERLSKRTTRRSRSPDAMSISPEVVISPNNKRKRKRETLKFRKSNKRSDSPLTKKARSK